MSFYHWFPSHPNECELSGDAGKLHEIGQELRITAATKEKRPPQTNFLRISSVPDVWSQHRLFDILLKKSTLDPSYLEYEEIAQREWQAILAVVVLAESYGVQLRTETVSFSADRAGSAHIRAAYSMRPDSENWKTMDIYYVEKNGHRYPIAMTSPTVHLVPTRDAWENLRIACPGRIPWLTGSMACSPVVLQGKSYVPLMLGETEKEKTHAMLPIHALLLKTWLSKYLEHAPKTQNQMIVEEYVKALTEAYHLDAENMPSIINFFVSEEQQGGTQLLGISVPKKLQIFLDRVFYAKLKPKYDYEVIPDTHRYAGGISPQNMYTLSKDKGEFAHFFIPMPVTEVFWKLWQENKDCNPTYTIDCDAASDDNLIKITVTLIFGKIQFSEVYLEKRIIAGDWHSLCTAGM